MASEWGLGKPRVKKTKPACRWCGYRAQAELKPSDPVIGSDLYECANVEHCIIRLRSKAKMVEVFGRDDADFEADSAARMRFAAFGTPL